MTVLVILAVVMGTIALRAIAIATVAVFLRMRSAIGRCLGTMNHRRVNTREGAVAIGSRNVHSPHHHLIHQ
jgi:hypothetical protein